MDSQFICAFNILNILYVAKKARNVVAIITTLENVDNINDEWAGEKCFSMLTHSFELKF